LEITNERCHFPKATDAIPLFIELAYSSIPSVLINSARPPVSYKTPACIAALHTLESRV
jgi:hypothetical protein